MKTEIKTPTSTMDEYADLLEFYQYDMEDEER